MQRHVLLLQQRVSEAWPPLSSQAMPLKCVVVATGCASLLPCVQSPGYLARGWLVLAHAQWHVTPRTMICGIQLFVGSIKELHYTWTLQQLSRRVVVMRDGPVLPATM